MTVRIAINGLGRIGRCVVRAIVEEKRDDIELVAVNGPAPIDTHIHLLKYDSVHGTFPFVEKFDENTLLINGKKVPLYRQRDPLEIPWGNLGVDIVLECTGKFNNRNDAAKHIEAGAKKVIISAPANDADAMIVYGVNHEVLTKEHDVISIGSCTTNCLAPVVKALDDFVGIDKGFMTTIHSYTNDQNIIDATHKDLRRARAGALSLVPTSTGAAKAIGMVLPQLEGKLDGVAIRVPTPNVSLVDLTFQSRVDCDANEINSIIKKACEEDYKGVMAYTEEQLVSIDYVHNPHSSIFDATGTKVLGNRFARIMAWYDNEWGFSIRMLDVTNLMGKMK
jgi:glyceraldehyde 3-phosphate dehydrogenase